MQITTPEIELVFDARNHLGETPVWSAAARALYWVNCEKPPELLRWDPASDVLQRWPMPKRIGGVVLTDEGLLVVLADGIYDFDPAGGGLVLRVASPLPHGIALHECAVDRSGRLWVGSINEAIGTDNLHPGGGVMFRLDGDNLVPLFDGFSCANGVAFSPDGRTLYFSDSPTGSCECWSVDPATGAVSDRRLLFQLGASEGFVDGATVDSDGGYWATLVYAGKLRRYRADGTLDREIDLPFLNPTKVAFGGDDLATLYITTMAEGAVGAVKRGRDGGLFAFRPGVAGLPEPLFRS